jgi:hypothetical protein
MKVKLYKGFNFFVYKKKACWACGFQTVVRWGKRQHCKNCGILFTRNAPQQRLENHFVWFKKWILERKTYKTLRRDSGLCNRTLQRIFYTFLELLQYYL